MLTCVGALLCSGNFGSEGFVPGMHSSLFSGIINAASLGRHGNGGRSSVQIHHDADGLQVHIQGTNEAMMDLLQYLPNPSRGPRLQRATDQISDGRSLLSSQHNVAALRRHGGMRLGGPYLYSGANRSAEDDTSASTPQPSVHPLLSVTDPRRARDLFTPSTSRGHAMVDTILSAIESHSNGGGYAARQMDPQQVRLGIANRRRPLNPFVSDRRWGTDVGEIDVVGARLQSLVESFTDSVSDMIESDSAAPSISTSTGGTAAIASTSGSVLWDSQRPSRRTAGQSFLERSMEGDRSGGSGRDGSGSSSNESSLRGPSDFLSTLLLGGGPSSRHQYRREPVGSASVSLSSGSTLGVDSNSSTSTATSASVETAVAGTGEDVEPTASNDMEIAEAQDPSPQPVPSASTLSIATDAVGSQPTATTETETAVEAVGSEGLTSAEGPTPVSASAVATGTAPEDTAKPMEMPSAESTEEQPVGSSSTAMQCPPGVDREVWDSLPTEMQLELSESMGYGQGAGLLEETELDRDILASLPPEMRTEVRHQ